MRATVCGRKPKSIELLDSVGIDIGPLVETAALVYDLPLVLLVGMLKAESGMYPYAERWGTRTAEAKTALAAKDWAGLRAIVADVWPDISFGLSQLIVSTAGNYGVGDKSSGLENVLYVRDRLFDRERSINLGAKHLVGCVAAAPAGDLLGALVVYNHGSYPAPDSLYWQRWAGNVAAYRAALRWAEEVTQ